VELDEKMVAEQAGRMWWLFLVTGLIWLLLSWLVLRYNVNPTTSVATVGVLVGVMFLFATVSEFLAAGATSGGWKVLHVVLGLIFALGALWGFFRPINTFYALASIIGLVFFLMGFTEIMKAVGTRHENDVWWLSLIVGIIELLLALWASQQYFPARAALILLWVGFFALFKGIGEIAMAFLVRRAVRAA
jgi:uncharacterized membrane protein HdeD (DUF308 family)